MDPKKLKAQLAAAFSEPDESEISRLVSRDLEMAMRMSRALVGGTDIVSVFPSVLRHFATVRAETRRARAFEAIANALPSFFPEPRPPRDEAGFDIPPGIDPN